MTVTHSAITTSALAPRTLTYPVGTLSFTGALHAVVGRHRFSTSLKPASTCCIVVLGRARTFSVSNARSMVNSCEMLTTEGLDSPESVLCRRTFPGADSMARLVVMIATMTEAMRLSLKALDCMTRTGRRNPGPEPVGGGNDAHQTSPRLMLEQSVLGRCQRGVYRGGLASIDLIELGGYSGRTTGAYIGSQGIGV